MAGRPSAAPRLERPPADRFQEVVCFRQQVTGPRRPDFADPFPTSRTLDDFAFVRTPLDELRRSPSLGVVMLCVGGSAAR